MRPRKENFMNLSYWVGLFAIIRTLCFYFRRWGGYLPTDLPAEVEVLRVAAEAACAAMALYDKAHPHGGAE